MKKALTVLALTAVAALPAFARYIVVLKDGTNYAAKQKWTVVNGKAIVLLENGQSLQLDPSLIDVARSERMTKVGMANANIIDLNPAAAPAPAKKQQPSLGDTIKLRRPSQQQQQEAPAPAVAVPTPGSGALPSSVIEKFDRAFENLGIYGNKLTATGSNSLRAEMTIDTEDRVFNALSAASYLMVRNAGVDGARIDMIELFMKTTSGGVAGRFQMSRADAEEIDKASPAARRSVLESYFVRKVIY